MLLEINEIGCCALTHAFMRNRDKIRALRNEIGPLKLLANILVGTRRIKFQPSFDQIVMYRMFATVELKRLTHVRDKPGFMCRHRIAEHCDALRALLQQFPKGH